ncbi:hypothetical protein BJ912DRAFT_1040252 [Pholiota molesta]|nr:hypothetical protein BJ912DRAFT_1040252 [Pholiota molesta]
MSSPIARRSPSPSAASSVSGSSTSSSSSGSSSPARGLYVPLHKRSAPSSTTSVSATSESSSSRPCSPSRRRTPGSPKMDAPHTAAHPRIYTTGYLLSLRPFATEGLKDTMRAACPEVVMNRRMRKSIEFNEHQARSASKREQSQQHQQQSPTLPPSFTRAPVHEAALEDTAISGTVPHPAAATASPAHAATAPRVTPRRTRPAGRAPERRRQALHHDTWHGLRSTGTPMPLVSV